MLDVLPDVNEVLHRTPFPRDVTPTIRAGTHEGFFLQKTASVLPRRLQQYLMALQCRFPLLLLPQVQKHKLPMRTPAHHEPQPGVTLQAVVSITQDLGLGYFTVA